MKPDKNFYYAYGTKLIRKISILAWQKANITNSPLFTKHEETNVSGELKTGFDQVMNQAVLDFVSERKEEFPLMVVSEETGVESVGNNPQYFMIVDSLDGSNNVRPWYTPTPPLCISLAFGSLMNLKMSGNHRAIEFSMHKEIFADRLYFSSVLGSYFQSENDDVRLRTSPVQNLGQGCILGLDIDFLSTMSEGLVEIISSDIVARRTGSTIMDLCHVASGQYDAFVSAGKRLKITDFCQPYHLITQAGGYIKIKPYIDGVECINDEHYAYLKQVVLEEKVELLRKLRFDLIAAGTDTLGKKLSDILKIN